LLYEICKYVGARFVRADGNRHLNRSGGSTDLSACAPAFPGNQLAATAANFAVNFAVHFDDIESLCAASHRVASCDLLDACESGEIDDATGAGLRAKLRGAGLAAGTSQSSSRRRPVRRKGHSFLNRAVTDHDLAPRTGSIIFSASQAGEMSLASLKIQKGFFMHGP
jgi:hypothetical protein